MCVTQTHTIVHTDMDTQMDLLPISCSYCSAHKINTQLSETGPGAQELTAAAAATVLDVQQIAEK